MDYCFAEKRKPAFEHGGSKRTLDLGWALETNAVVLKIARKPWM